MVNKSEKTLDSIFGSRAKTKILKLFLYNPNIVLSAKDISKKTGFKHTICNIIVGDLKRLGFLVKAKNNYGKNKKNKKTLKKKDKGFYKKAR